MKSVTRRKKAGRKGSFLPLLLVMVLFAGGLGYGVTKWVVLPSFSPQSAVPTAPPQTVESGDKEDAAASDNASTVPPQSAAPTAPSHAVEPGESEQVYAIQFGSYSTYEGAQAAALQEVSKGHTVRIVEKGGSYKIVGSPYTDRTEAERALAAISPEGEDGLFITTMEVLTQ